MQGLKQKALSSVRWTTINSISTTIIYFVQLAILGRLLGPEAFGIMAMVMIVVEFSNIFANFGLSDAIIQRKNNEAEVLTTLYWINVALGIILFVAIVLLTPIIADIFGVDSLNSYLPITALAFVFSSFGVQFQTLLRKTLRFDILAKVNILSAFFGLCIAVAIAGKGYGVWALVGGYIANAFFRTLFFMIWGFRSAYRPGLSFRWDNDTRDYLGFGLYRMGAMAANEFNSRVDQLLIGMLMGPLALGYYNFAFRLVLQPVQMLNPVLTQVALPLFSIVQDDTVSLKKGFLKMVQLLMVVIAPLLIGLAAISPVAVPFFVGEKWMQSVPLVQVIAFYAIIRSLMNAGGSLIIAKGKANWTLYWNIALIFFIAPVIYLASLGGEVIYIALALVVMQLILFLCHYRIFIIKLIGPCFSEYIQSFGRPILISFAIGLTVIACSFLTFDLPVIIRLSSQVVIGVITYILCYWFFQRTVFFELIELFPIWHRSRKVISQKSN